MLGHLSANIICSEKRIDNVQEEISENIIVNFPVKYLGI